MVGSKNIKLNIKHKFIPERQGYLREQRCTLFLISNNYYYEYHTYNKK